MDRIEEKEVVQEEEDRGGEVDLGKIDGEEMIDGQEDHHLMKEEAHQAIVAIKILKLLCQSVLVTKCNFFLNRSILKKLLQKR